MSPPTLPCRPSETSSLGHGGGGAAHEGVEVVGAEGLLRLVSLHFVFETDSS